MKHTYSDDYFTSGGTGYPNYLEEGALLKKRARRYARLLHRYSRPGALLDVGAAAGFLLQGFVDEGWTGIGLEPNERMAEYARADLGLDVRTGSLEEFGRPGRRFDLITMIQVVPHLYDLRAALNVAAELTKPGGIWLIEAWNRESLSARAFGRRWHEYDPPRVLHWFSPAGLRRLVADYGFSELARGRPLRWISGAHAKSILRGQLSSLPPMGSVLRRIVTPIPSRWRFPYPGDDLFWGLYKKR